MRRPGDARRRIVRSYLLGLVVTLAVAGFLGAMLLLGLPGYHMIVLGVLFLVSLVAVILFDRVTQRADERPASRDRWSMHAELMGPSLITLLIVSLIVVLTANTPADVGVYELFRVLFLRT
jgi:hypothetical protein